MRDLRAGVRRALVEAYNDGMFWWEAAMMVQRLVRVGVEVWPLGCLACRPCGIWFVSCVLMQVLGLVFTFCSGQPGVQALVLTLLCITYGVLHATVIPMRSPVVGPVLVLPLVGCAALVCCSQTGAVV